MKSPDPLRQHLLELLDGGHAHLDFDAAIADLPEELRGSKPSGLPHTPWRLLEHLRIAQWDILRFCVDPNHMSPEFPAGYWPEGEAPPDSWAWDRSVESFRSDLQLIKDLVADPKTDLFARSPTARARRSFERPCSWPITIPTISASLSPCVASWVPGAMNELLEPSRNRTGHTRHL